MAATMYDLAVIGGGSGGLTAARFGVALGAKVALIDRAPEALGGDCLHTGCVPSKALIHAARAYWEAGRTERWGLPGRAPAAPVDLGRVMDGIRAVQAEAGEVDTPEALRAFGIDLHFGRAEFRSPDLLTVDGRPVRARRYIIATGSRPAIPPIPGLREVPFLTNDTIFELRALPPSLLVLGGGPIGCELAQAFGRLGARATIVGRAPRLLPREDPEASETLAGALAGEGVELVLGATVERVARDGDEIVATVRRGGETFGCRAAALLVATGRRVETGSLGLGAVGVVTDESGAIVVDDWGRTTAAAIYACGDVIGRLQFTHAAGYQAATAVRNALLPARALGACLDERPIPWATFTTPEVARVGLTEAEARREHDGAAAVRFPYRQVDRALTAREGGGGYFIKLVHDRRGKILGGQIVGPDAGETINEVAIAMRNGLGLADLGATIHVYPTLSMGVQQAALAWRFGSPAADRARRLLRPLFRWQRRRAARAIAPGEGLAVAAREVAS